MINIDDKEIYIIGGKSRLAKAIVSSLKKQNIKYKIKNVLLNGSEPNSIFKDLLPKRLENDGNRLIFNCLADTAGEKGQKLQNYINYDFAYNLCESYESDLIVNFGSNTEETNIDSTYLDAKRRLCENLADSHNSYYFKLSTLYGYYPLKKGMFLSLLYNSIRKNEDFNMSSGDQLREYHRYSDVVLDIMYILKKSSPGIFPIKSNDSVAIKDIALAVRDELNPNMAINFCVDKIEHEVYRKGSEKSTSIYSKTNIENIVAFLRECYERDNTRCRTIWSGDC